MLGLGDLGRCSGRFRVGVCVFLIFVAGLCVCVSLVSRHVIGSSVNSTSDHVHVSCTLPNQMNMQEIRLSTEKAQRAYLKRKSMQVTQTQANAFELRLLYLDIKSHKLRQTKKRKRR